MKRNSLKWLLLIALFGVSCTKSNVNDFPEQLGKSNIMKKIVSSGATLFSAQTGRIIYTAGIYRYGPSIIINSDGSIDAWFSTPGDTYNTKLYNDGDGINKTAVAISGTNTVAQKFTSSNSFYGIGVQIPTWGSSVNTLTLKLYKWNTSYATTIGGTALATQTFSNFLDNSTLKLTKTALYPADTYLWIVSQPTGTVGVYQYSVAKANETQYLNGAVVTGAFKAFIFQTPGSDTGVTSYWDQVSYKRSTNGGVTWSAEQMVLLPTRGTRDQLSICDPGVCKWGSYYYLGYTSTENTTGKANHVYMARSTSTTGPWEKWNGSGWGGAPQPVITYTGSSSYFGAGEPCMVVQNNIVYLYYTWNEGTTTTRVATASATNANWPAALTLRGTAIDKTAIAGSDHCDVKFRDDIQKFQAIHAASRMSATSHIAVWESTDGITFTNKGGVNANLQPYLHNCGWSGSPSGHIETTHQNYISYAYGTNYGFWNTYWNPISF